MRLTWLAPKDTHCTSYVLQMTVDTAAPTEIYKGSGLFFEIPLNKPATYRFCVCCVNENGRSEWGATVTQIVEKPSTPPGIQCDFSTPFDENGALYYIATNGYPAGGLCIAGSVVSARPPWGQCCSSSEWGG